VDRIERSANAVKNHQTKLDGLTELMGVYRDLLGEEAKYEDAKEKIEAAVVIVSEKIGKLQQGTAASVAKAVAATPGVKGLAVKRVAKLGKSEIVEAALTVLKAEGKELDYRSIVDRAIAMGLYAGKCKDPYNSFNSTLLRNLELGETRFVRVGRGVYALAA